MGRQELHEDGAEGVRRKGLLLQGQVPAFQCGMSEDGRKHLLQRLKDSDKAQTS